MRSIYEAPLAYHRQGLDQAVLDAFQISPAPRPDLHRWEDVVERIENPDGSVRIAIVGKYTQLDDAYKSLAEVISESRFPVLGSNSTSSTSGRRMRPR